MQVTWRISTPHDPAEDSMAARQRMRDWATAQNIAYRDLRWLSEQTTPAHWIGYNDANPSPGYTICQHHWETSDEDIALMLYLTFGNKIEKREVNND
jgi:hypothetical protein